MLTIVEGMRAGRLVAAGFLVAVLLGAAGLMIRAQSGNLIYACVAKDGTIRIVASAADCTKNQTATWWSQRGGGLSVVDKDGKLVGYPFGLSASGSAGGEQELLVSINDRWYRFTVTVDGLFGVPDQSTPQLFFESPGCVGTGYVLPDPVSFYHKARWVDGQTAYLAAATTGPRLVESAGSPWGGCAGLKEPSTMDLAELIAVDLSGFAPPFRFAR